VKRALGALFLLLGACDGCKRPTDALPSASSASSAAPPPAAADIRAIVRAEQARDSKALGEELLSHRDVAVRRSTARALARIADEQASGLLKKAIADEDPGVVSWAAYGLGYSCKGHEPATVRVLVARAASFEAAPVAKSQAAEELWDPVAAIADALGRCATIEAEHTLRVWLEGSDPRAEAAALALGRMASRAKRLDDASIVALLDAASRPERPITSALFAFSRLSGLSGPVQERLLSVARDALSADGQRRAFAVRALGRAGEGAVEPLSTLLLDAKQEPALRAIAARELSKLGQPGQRALAGAVGKLLTPPPPKTRLLSAEWLPIAATLEALTSAPEDARAALEPLTELALPGDATPALKRRIVEIRCRSASLLAGTASLHPKLVKCDPDADGRAGKLAVLRVLDRANITGARHTRWLDLSKSRDPVVRQAALELLNQHAEVAQAWQALADALRADQAGTVAVAARVLADHPDRASSDPPKKGDDKLVAVKPERALVDALVHAFGVQRPGDAVETRAALIDAAGALQLLSLKPPVAKHCDDDNPTLRAAAEKALRLFGERNRQCRRAKPGKAPAELGLDRPDEVKVVLDTDAGELALTLDARLAPVTAARISDLVRAGFYDGIVFHRVVPGFVVQFGDPGGDGYGGAGKAPLRCETSPATFTGGSVGIALGGRDTGSSQLFVTIAPYPHLDGDYPLVGRAGAGWDRIAQGDRIKKARLVE
jgi:cyclophilin family peptidyl-prolyl cis-trans isomerase